MKNNHRRTIKNRRTRLGGMVGIALVGGLSNLYFTMTATQEDQEQSFYSSPFTGSKVFAYREDLSRRPSTMKEDKEWLYRENKAATSTLLRKLGATKHWAPLRPARAARHSEP